MTLFYNIGISAYTLAIKIASPFNEKAALWVKGRKGIRNKIESINRGSERLVWFHAASLGEFEQGRPVMEALKKAEPETKILLTFFSPSGYEIRKNYTGADYILYLPADTVRNARHFIKHLHPDAAVFIKYEFWYHYLNELHNAKIPTYLISAIFRKEQPFFKSWGGLHRRMLEFFNTIFVQDRESVDLLKCICITTAKETGDTRFDRVKEIANNAKVIDRVERFIGNAPAFVAGSSWQPDEEILFDFINQYNGNYKWIIAPHEIGEGHIKNILQRCQKKCVRFTDENIDPINADVLIIDCIGLLSSIYRYGKISYIGGGFGVGIHNTLEAAVYGIPVIFGPNYKRFLEAVDLIEKGGAFSISNGKKLNDILSKMTSQPELTAKAGTKALDYVNSKLGATPIIVNKLIHG